MSVEVDEKIEQDDELLREPALAGLLGQFEDVDSVMKAARHCRDAGFMRWDVHTPFPVHGMDEAMGIRPTILPWLVLGAGLTGTMTGLGLQWYANVFEYPFITSGKPLFSPMFAFPISYELTILFTAFATIGGMFFLNGLPMHYHPLLKYEKIRRGMDDQMFIVIEARDPRFNLANTKALLEKAGGKDIKEIEA